MEINQKQQEVCDNIAEMNWMTLIQQDLNHLKLNQDS